MPSRGESSIARWITTPRPWKQPRTMSYDRTGALVTLSLVSTSRSWVLPSHIPLSSMGQALVDAEQAIKLAPGWPKGYSRKAAALFFLGELDQSHAAYSRALELDPKDDLVRQVGSLLSNCQVHSAGLFLDRRLRTWRWSKSGRRGSRD